MFAALSTTPYLPFATAVAVLAALVVVEVVLLVMGGSLMGDVDGPAVELDVPDIDAPDMAALEAGVADPAAFEVADAGAPAAVGQAGHWTGLGRVPFLVWFAAFLAGFAIAGLAVQGTGPWPLWLAVPVAGVAGTAVARVFGRAFARAVPRLETAALQPRHLARRRGVVSQGTARRGSPAELRVVDRYGNTHWLRAEPLREADTINRGSEVLTVWDRRAQAIRIVALD